MEEKPNSNTEKTAAVLPTSFPAVVSTPNMIEKAESIAARIEQANIKTEELLRRQEEIQARNVLSGRAEAGLNPTPAPVETAKEYANRVMNNKLK